MASRKPIVQIGGRLKELPAGDTINAGGGVSQRDMSNYTGADVALALGEVAFYDFTNITSLPFRLASQTNQYWEVDFLFDHPVPGAFGAVLQPNNAAFGSAVCSNQRSDISETGASNGGVSANSSFQLIQGNKPSSLKLKIRTRTEGKTVDTEYRVLGASSASNSGSYFCTCSDITTVWGSLGTVVFNSAVSGRCFVRLVGGNAANNTVTKIARHILWRVLDKTQDWPDNNTLAVGGDLVLPFDGNILDIEADVDTAGVGGVPVIDVNRNGATIMTTDKLKWDSTEKSTRSYSGNAPGLTTVAVLAGDIITLDVDTNNTTTRAKGLTLYLQVEQL